MDAIGLDEVVVRGTDGPVLRNGPGHYPETPLPGAGGTVAIAGHRTTYGAPFRDVDELGKGDRIELEMPYGHFSYRVERTRIVAADGDMGDAPDGVRSARADRVPSALFRGRADRRVRAPRAVRPELRVVTLWAAPRSLPMLLET